VGSFPFHLDLVFEYALNASFASNLDVQLLILGGHLLVTVSLDSFESFSLASCLL
jgi:hypothetical protein